MPEPFCSTEPPTDAARAFVAAVKSNDADKVRELLANDSELRTQINEPWFDFDGTAVLVARHDRPALDVLLEFGADINARSKWWAGGFGIMDGVDAATADYLMSRGAKLDIHAAAALGRVDDVRAFLDADPSLAYARGGDGQTPLHVAGTLEMVDLLASRMTNLEMRDLDHSATAAQYLVNKPELCNCLLEHGAQADIFMACALGRPDLVESVLKSRPEALADEVGACSATQKVHERSSGHIYCWRLHGATTPLEVAAVFGHSQLHVELYQRSPIGVQFVRACFLADEDEVQRILLIHPDIVSKLNDRQQASLARAAWEGRLDAVRVMLSAGFDPHVRGDEASTPLDRAAFHGHRAIVELLLAHDDDPPLEWRNAYGGTPLRACCYGAVHGWKWNTDYPGTVEALIHAGARIDPRWLPTGNERIDEILRKHLDDQSHST